MLLKRNEIIVDSIDNTYLLFNPADKKIVLLNEISYQLFNNCNSKTMDELIDYIYSTINNRDEIQYKQMKSECENAIQQLIANGFIVDEGSDQ